LIRERGRKRSGLPLAEVVSSKKLLWVCRENAYHAILNLGEKQPVFSLNTAMSASSTTKLTIWQ
jgi:hypothetical protein